MEDLSKDEVRRLDTVIEDDIARGFRVKPVPEDIQREIKDEGFDPPTIIRLSRVNPARRRSINEEVQRRYHRDIRNPDVLSNAQVLKEVSDRGEWNADMQKRMETLQERTTRDMADLWGDGLTPDTSTFANEIVGLVKDFHAAVAASERTDAEKATTLEVFDKWAGWTPSSKDDPDYTDYEPLVAQAQLYELAPSVEAVDMVNSLEELKDKQDRLLRLAEERVELTALQLKHARIFADTAESRRDHTEEMAQLFFTCDRSDANGVVKGKLTASFEELWNYPDKGIKWLLYESFFFHHNVPDAAREYLGAFGFLPAERGNSANDPSEGSPAPQSSNLDGVPAAKTPVDSGDSAADTTSTTAS